MAIEVILTNRMLSDTSYIQKGLSSLTLSYYSTSTGETLSVRLQVGVAVILVEVLATGRKHTMLTMFCLFIWVPFT